MSPLDRPCQFCGAAIGEFCTAGGKARAPHNARLSTSNGRVRGGRLRAAQMAQKAARESGRRRARAAEARRANTVDSSSETCVESAKGGES